MPENKASNRVLEKAGMRFSDYNIETNRNRFVAETGSFG
jgi:RimJ/RimL family protein N-acetyltransferase